MFRLSLLLALALTPAASALAPTNLMPTNLAPVAVQPDWQRAGSFLLGFTEAGELVTQRDNSATLDILDAATGQPGRTIVFPEVPNPRDIAALTFTPDLKTLAWVNSKGDAVTVRTPSGEWTTPPANGVQLVRRLALSPDGQTLAVSTSNSYVQLWDTARRTRRHTLLRMTDPLAFSPDGQTLAATRVFASGITLWNVATGGRRLYLPQLAAPARPLRFLPDGTLLAGKTRTTLDLSRLEQGDIGFTTQAFTPYLEACPPGSPWKLCRRDPRTGSASGDGERFLMGIFRTPQFRAAGLLYDKAGRLLQVLDVGEGNLPELTPDGRRLVWQSRRGELLSGPVSP